MYYIQVQENILIVSTLFIYLLPKYKVCLLIRNSRLFVKRIIFPYNKLNVVEGNFSFEYKNIEKQI